ncbi:hypothetical protein EVAR_51932_1 [Eumeta japonica]|uniref:Uncharacterized protein n=1 Tax=Eumeta variegata TaxID=151549 RepID=A0A4C1YJ99_EUMVA|nr:hypothetical protein EVAR_51932_1 [Eumeta japonica]
MSQWTTLLNKMTSLTNTWPDRVTPTCTLSTSAYRVWLHYNVRGGGRTRGVRCNGVVNTRTRDNRYTHCRRTASKNVDVCSSTSREASERTPWVYLQRPFRALSPFSLFIHRLSLSPRYASEWRNIAAMRDAFDGNACGNTRREGKKWLRCRTLAWGGLHIFFHMLPKERKM